MIHHCSACMHQNIAGDGSFIPLVPTASQKARRTVRHLMLIIGRVADFQFETDNNNVC